MHVAVLCVWKFPMTDDHYHCTDIHDIVDMHVAVLCGNFLITALIYMYK